MGIIEKVGVFYHGSIGVMEDRLASFTESLGAEKTTELLRERYHYHKAQEDFWKKEYDRIEEEKFPKPVVRQAIRAIEDEDIELVGRIKQRVVNNHDKIKDMKNQDLIGRISTMNGIVEELAEDFEVDINDVILFFPDPDNPDFKEDYYTAGEHVRDRKDITNHYIRINAMPLIYDDIDGYESVLLSSVHELMHARQWEAATRQKDFGFSNDRLLEWYDNWLPGNYIQPDVDDEKYRKQPVERDAYRLERVIKDFIETLK